MDSFEINIVKKYPKDKLYREYLYSFYFVVNKETNNRGLYYQSLNRIAQCLLTNIIKLKNTLTKSYNGIILKEKGSSYWDKEYSFVYFKTEDDANNAKEWMLSLYMSNQITGTETIYKQRREKAAIAKTKSRAKEFQKLSKFIGLTANTTLNTSVGSFKFKTTINDITQKGDNYIIQTSNGEVTAYHRVMKFTDTEINLSDRDYYYSFEFKKV